MKKILIASAISFFTVQVIAQADIGIGTSLPQAKLHVVGNLRVGGINPNSSFISFDSLNGQFRWNNSSLSIPTSQSIIQHSASAEGLFYNSPNLEYRYQDGTPSFSVNHLTGNGFFKGRLGIGNTALAPVHLASVIGAKAIFWGESADFNYGIDVQSYRLLIHNDQGPDYLPSHISFGYGSSSNFTETMRILSTGSVGLGTSFPEAAFDVRKLPGYSTADFYGTNHITHFNWGPNENTYIRGGKNNSEVTLGDVAGNIVGVGIEPDAFLASISGSLQVAGRTLIRSGGSLATSAGIWFHNRNNTIAVGFIGMENDDYVGFFGSGIGWSFGMNTVSGALKAGGSTGTPGTVLQTNGANMSPTWVSPTKSVFDNTLVASSNTPIDLNWNTLVEIPGLNVTFSTPGNAKVLIRYNIVLTPQGNCSTLQIGVRAFGEMNFSSNGTENRHSVTCNKENSVSGTLMLEINGSGSHRIALHASKASPALNATASCSCALANIMIAQVINE